MPRVEPPAVPPGRPRTITLARETLLWRLHSTRFDATQFNPTKSDNPFRGGRFDSADGSFSYLYAGEHRDVAVAETLLRDIPLAEFATSRLVPRVSIAKKKISAIRLQHDVELAYLSGEGASALGQDTWLTHCDSGYYPHTRAWALSIRDWLPTIGGLAWRSRVDDDSFSYVFFADRLPADVLVRADPGVGCESQKGLRMIRQALGRYSAALVPVL